MVPRAKQPPRGRLAALAGPSPIGPGAPIGGSKLMRSRVPVAPHCRRPWLIHLSDKRSNSDEWIEPKIKVPVSGEVLDANMVKCQVNSIHKR
jgi:hypothetical protein